MVSALEGPPQFQSGTSIFASEGLEEKERSVKIEQVCDTEQSFLAVNDAHNPIIISSSKVKRTQRVKYSKSYHLVNSQYSF
jgi:hypothetical protein